MTDYLFKNRGKPSKLTFKKWLEDRFMSMPYQKMARSSAEATLKKYENGLNKAIQMCKKKNAGRKCLEKLSSDFESADKVNIIIMVYSYY